MPTLKTLIGILGIVSATSALATTATLSGLRSGEGHLAVSVFTEAEKSAFPGLKNRAIKTFYIALEGRKEISLDLEDLPAGTYAIAALHDENSSGGLDTGLFGLPKEGFGFSENPRVFFGAPSFRRAAFVSEKGKNLRIEIRYF